MEQAAIKTLIMARFDKFMAEKNATPVTNGHAASVKDESEQHVEKASSPGRKMNQKRESDDEDLSDVPDTPPRKKKRKPEPAVDDDAAFAARLQAEENVRARPTRGGATRKAAVVKKKKGPKKKTSSKVKAEDDSDVEGSGSEAEEKKVNRSGGFHVNCPNAALIHRTNRPTETSDVIRTFVSVTWR